MQSAVLFRMRDKCLMGCLLKVFSWSALITGYAQEGHAEQALGWFKEMQRHGILPNVVTFTCILKACATIKVANKGNDEISAQGLLHNHIVLGNALVDMYAKSMRGRGEANMLTFF